MEKTIDRIKVIMRTSIIGIIVNTLLAGFKIIVGGIAGSIAVMLDGVNNLSDAGSSLITILGAALAAKQPDRKHPFGYGRMEYLSSLVIAGFVLYAGITSLVESIKKIINPEVPDYSTLTLVLIIVAVFVKLFLALYTGKMGRQANSDALIASGKDALMDVVLSTSTIVAAIIYMTTGYALEAFLGIIISVIIIKAGTELLRETISKILGESGDAELAIAVKKTISSFDGVYGAFDLVLNDYGPEKYLASVHIEIDESLPVTELDGLTRHITEKVLAEHSVYLTGVGIYARNKSSQDVVMMETEIGKMALAEEYVKGFHGFYVDYEQKKIHFDIVISLDAADRRAVYDGTIDKIKERYPEYEYHVGMDMDMNELV